MDHGVGEQLPTTRTALYQALMGSAPSDIRKIDRLLDLPERYRVAQATRRRQRTALKQLHRAHVMTLNQSQMDQERIDRLRREVDRLSRIVVDQRAALMAPRLDPSTPQGVTAHA